MCFEDEAGVVEIASPILMTKDFGFLAKIAEFQLASKEFDARTGLHMSISGCLR